MQTILIRQHATMSLLWYLWLLHSLLDERVHLSTLSQARSPAHCSAMCMHAQLELLSP